MSHVPLWTLKTIAHMTLLLLLLGQDARAWSRHNLVTSAILSKAGEIQDMTVLPEDTQSLFDAFQVNDQLEWNENLKIRKDFALSIKLSEDAPAPLKLSDVLAVYSDEPDWDMDTELFGNDQYPELWNPDYAMMGGKKGTSSQAFRHMLWPFLPENIWGSMKLPIRQALRPMGEAPKRFELFLDLSRRASAAHLPYWSARFLANALHYIEDIANPFHSTQIPSKRFLLMPLLDFKNGSGFSKYVDQVTHIIAYYHFAFEDFIAYMMDISAHPSEVGQTLVDALASGDRFFDDHESEADISALKNNPGKIVALLASASVKKAAESAHAAISYFPRISIPFATMDPKRMLDETWWKQVTEKAQTDSSDRRRYVSVVAQQFQNLGTVVRAIVQSELESWDSHIQMASRTRR